MASGRLNKEIDSLDIRINKVAERFSESKERISKVSLEDDVRTVRRFPYFLVISLVFWIVMFVAKGVYTFTSAIQCLCLSFMICFMFAGIYRYRRMGDGPFPRWFMALIAIGLVLVLILFDTLTKSIMFHNAIYDMGVVIGIEFSDTFIDIVAPICLFFVFLFTTIGVLSVLVACLRVYLVRVFINMQKHCGKGVRKKAEKFFAVPDIIDPQEVVLEPNIDFNKFDTESAFNLSSYMILMMLMISSYVFLNPFFLDTMSVNDMISIMFMLSMFVPTLIVPWQIMRDLNARVVSEAHRDYYLWTGARRKLTNTFLALGAFSMMFLLSLYYGHDPADIVMNYVLFFIPLFLISIIYSTIYTNNFQNELKVAVLSRFLNGKEKMDEESNEN